MSLRWKIRRWRSLDGAERRLFLGAWWRVGLVRLMLWVLPFRVWKKWLILHEEEPGCPDYSETERLRLAKISFSVRLASRYFPRADTCLVHAIAAQRLARRHGFRSSVHIGITRGDDGGFGAHAWLESRGLVVIGELQDGAVAEQYRRLTTLGAGASGAGASADETAASGQQAEDPVP